MGHHDSCQAIEPLLTPVADGEASGAERARVDAHIAQCPPCAEVLDAAREARQWIRADAARLRAGAHAPASLQARCRRAVERGAPRRRVGRWVVPVSVAATFLVAVGGILLVTLVPSGRALAAELTTDHRRCFAREPGEALMRPTSLMVEGTQVSVPGGNAVSELELKGLWRCRHTGGTMAHALYRSHGQQVSLFVMPTEHRRLRLPAIMEGYAVRTWTDQARTYAMVGAVSEADLDRLVTAVRKDLSSRQGVQT